MISNRLEDSHICPNANRGDEDKEPDGYDEFVSLLLVHGLNG